MIVVDLIYNLALLIAVSVIAGFIDKRWHRSTLNGKIMQGLLFGMVAMLAMMNHFVIAEGVIFDGRSVVLSLCALFFGPVAGAIAVVMAVATRLYIGGEGIAMGVSVIFSSTMIGVIFYYVRAQRKITLNFLRLLLFGFLVHIAMLALMVLLPFEVRILTLQTLGFTVLGIYPVATVLAGKILLDQEENDKLMQDLRHGENQYRSLVQEMQQGLAVFRVLYDNEGKAQDYKFLLVNRNYEKLTGLKQADIAGKTIQEVFPSTEEFWNERFAKVAETSTPEYYENYSLELNRYYDVVVYRPAKHQLAVILTDITDRKGTEAKLVAAKEQAEAGDRLKSAFMNNISHEIRTPLNGIMGFSQLLSQEEISDHDRQQYLDLLQNSVERLIHTVTDYMDVSLIASGNLKLNYAWFRIDEFCDELLNKYSKPAKEKNLTLGREIPDTRIQLFSDRELLRKACDHLMNNAIKFTHKGSIKLGFDPEGDDVRFFVEDTGIGIDQQSLDRIFEAFNQIENTQTRSYEGSGLGLTIARGIIRQLGGRIWVESEKDKGSVFYFQLPKLIRTDDGNKEDF